MPTTYAFTDLPLLIGRISDPDDPLVHIDIDRLGEGPPRIRLTCAHPFDDRLHPFDERLHPLGDRRQHEQDEPLEGRGRVCFVRDLAPYEDDDG